MLGILRYGGIEIYDIEFCKWSDVFVLNIFRPPKYCIGVAPLFNVGFFWNNSVCNINIFFAYNPYPTFNKIF